MSRTNGKETTHISHNTVTPAPSVVTDLAASCVRFVERSVGFKLDYEPETLPVLDHYVTIARTMAHERKETAPLVEQAIGAYIGEVTRRKYGGYWRLEDTNDPRSFRVELEPVYLVLRPIELASRAVALEPEASPAPDASMQPRDDGDEDDGDSSEEGSVEGAPAALIAHDPDDDIRQAMFEVDEDDREVIAQHLAALPPVTPEQFYAPSTYFEVVELIVETIRARRVAAGMEPDAHLEPDDYST